MSKQKNFPDYRRVNDVEILEFGSSGGWAPTDRIIIEECNCEDQDHELHYKIIGKNGGITVIEHSVIKNFIDETRIDIDFRYISVLGNSSIYNTLPPLIEYQGSWILKPLR